MPSTTSTSTSKPTPDLSVTSTDIGTDHPNAQRLRDAFDAFGRGDLAAVRAHMTEDCTWTNAGTGPLAGTSRGWDEIAAMFGRLMEATGGTFRMDVRTVLADDTHAIAVYDSTSTVEGREATFRFVLVDELAPDGRVMSTHGMAYDQPAADAHVGAATR